MIKLNNVNAVADNTIAINGVVVAKLDDTNAQRLLSIIKGLESGAPITSATKSAEKTRYEYKKDLDPKWTVEKAGGLYVIKSGIYSKQRIAKTIANRYIKALDGIETVKVEYSDGSGKTYNAWGYKTKKK